MQENHSWGSARNARNMYRFSIARINLYIVTSSWARLHTSCFWCYIKLKREGLLQHPALQEGIVTRKYIVPCSRGIRFTFHSVEMPAWNATMTTSSNVTDAFSLTTSVLSVCNNTWGIIHHHMLQAQLCELVLMLWDAKFCSVVGLILLILLKTSL
jgi:hypothetical protein